MRVSEKAADEMRDPADRKAPDRYRIIWLEERVGVMYEAMLKAGKAKFGAALFHMSWTYFLDLRPFYVKDATRETCMCVYHLRWTEMANSLHSYRTALRQQKVATSYPTLALSRVPLHFWLCPQTLTYDVASLLLPLQSRAASSQSRVRSLAQVVSCSCSVPRNEKELRKSLCCPRAAGAKLDNIDCIMQRCGECKDLKKLTSGPGSLCAEEMRDPGGAGLALSLKVEMYEKQAYTTKDGTTKEKKDFVSRVLPFSTFKEELGKYISLSSCSCPRPFSRPTPPNP